MPAACLLLHLVGVSTLLGASVQAGEPRDRDVPFTHDDRRYQARLVLPEASKSSGVCVLLIAGGTAGDLHWTVPASYTIDGKTTELTIDGEPTRDADTLARALADAGFVVMQWSSIHEGDAQGKANPAMATGMPFTASVDLARAAYAHMLSQPEVGGTSARVIMLGHSLGATRASLIADDRVVGMVFLAGAYLSKLGPAPSKFKAQTMELFPGLDADANAIISPAEWNAFGASNPGHEAAGWLLTDLDRDASGDLDWWEIGGASVVGALKAGRPAPVESRPLFRDGFRWPIDLVQESAAPVLAVYAGRDQISIHAPLLEHAFARSKRVRVEYFAHLGHQLGKEQDTKTGPIEPAVVARVVEWCRDIASAGAAKKPE